MDKLIENGVKVDMILTDPPYGTTRCKWDSAIPFDQMWEQIHSVAKKNAAILLFGSEPFSSALRMSNIKKYKYDWIWDKVKPSGHLNAKKMPMMRHENISVFSYGAIVYNPQGLIKGTYNNSRPSKELKKCDTPYGATRIHGVSEYTNYPHEIIVFSKPNDVKRLHPTQKPVALLEYLIKTYTNEGETVLDFTMGSGSTGVACINTNRNFIGIELDQKYYNIARSRLQAAQK